MDWNNDGHLDILSGCYWTSDAKAGHIQLLAGKGTLDFDAAVAVTNADGAPVENAKIDDAEGKDGFADNQLQTICTHQHAVDYDGDGDRDLVVGCFGPEFFLHENTGTDAEIRLNPVPVLLPVQINGHHAAPHLVDWDGDGDLDLLSGTSEGGVVFAENTGTRQQPAWSEFRPLIAATNSPPQSKADGEVVQPSNATRVWAYDWNRDGLLDLLVGDSVHISHPKEGISPEEFEKRQAEYQTRIQEASLKYQTAYEEFSKSEGAGESPDEEQQNKFNSAREEFQKVYESREEFQVDRQTGYVWLYLRKPTGQDKPDA